MTLRPLSARWFEMLTLPRDLTVALECLSQTGFVELESKSEKQHGLLAPDINAYLQRYREQCRLYGSLWPVPILAEDRSDILNGDRLLAAQAAISSWIKQADPLIAAQETLAEEMADLSMLDAALACAPPDLPDIQRLANAGPALQAALLLLPLQVNIEPVPPTILSTRWSEETASYLLAVGPAADLVNLRDHVLALKGRNLLLPTWLPSRLADDRIAIAGRRSELERKSHDLSSQLSMITERTALAKALGDMALLDWLDVNALATNGDGRLAWITGWTIDVGGQTLRQALERRGLRYVLTIRDPPFGKTPPEILHNPRWIQPFELFIRLLGLPASGESDPSAIVAVIASLIFGFMFADMGQGLILILGGLAFHRHFALSRLLIPGGMTAMGFGLLFGSLFCRDDVVPALWIRPLSAPITILIVGICVGVAVMITSLLLNALQMHWRGEAAEWWGRQAGLVAAYLGIVLCPFWLASLLATALGFIWYVAGAVLFSRNKTGVAVVSDTGRFIQEVLELLVNTLSFARIGAFALGHAGLSLAIVQMADATGSIGYWVVLALGNALVIVLEGAVAGIQTTRLLLFEFFTHFITGTGRAFAPLKPPPVLWISPLQPTTRSLP